MTLNVKQIVTVGLGLGVATAFGYHYLTADQTPQQTTHLSQPFKPVAELYTASTPTPVASQPAPAFHDRTTGIKPLSRRMHGDVILNPTPSLENNQPAYQDLVDSLAESKSNSNEVLPAAMVPELSLPPAQPIVQATNNVVDEFNSLQITETATDDSEFEFSLDDEPSMPVSPVQTLREPAAESTFAIKDASATETLNIEGPAIADAKNETFETEFDTNADQPETMASETDTRVVKSRFIPASTKTRTAAQQDSQQQTSGWKANPFLSNQPSAEAYKTIAAAPVEKEISFDASKLTDGEVADIQRSIVSLNDPIHEVIDRQVESLVAEATTQVPDRATLTNDGVPFSQGRIEPVQLTISEDAAQKAVHHIEYGKTLSRRGAAFSARQEFLAALQIISVANDKATGSNRHSLSLRKAMLIIREAADFSVASPEQQIQMDVANVVDSHRSKVISKEQAAGMTPVQAMNRYFATAQNHLDIAGGRNVVSAEVFFCMGKLHTLLNRTKQVLNPFDTAQSVVYHQAALLSDANHHRSANELGVLLARNGRLDQAKLLFERSLLSNPAPQAWQNLAITHQRLGAIDYANRAQNEFNLLASQGISTATDGIQWKAINQFNADAPVEFNRERVASLPEKPATEKTATKNNPTKTFSERLKDMF